MAKQVYKPSPKSLKKKPTPPKTQVIKEGIDPNKVIKTNPKMISENFKTETITFNYPNTESNFTTTQNSGSIYYNNQNQFLTLKSSFPEYVGGYRIGKNPGYVQFNLTNKPNWLHRKFSKLLLGWEWVDNKN